MVTDLVARLTDRLHDRIGLCYDRTQCESIVRDLLNLCSKWPPHEAIDELAKVGGCIHDPDVGWRAAFGVILRRDGAHE